MEAAATGSDFHRGRSASGMAAGERSMLIVTTEVRSLLREMMAVLDNPDAFAVDQFAELFCAAEANPIRHVPLHSSTRPLGGGFTQSVDDVGFDDAYSNGGFGAEPAASDAIAGLKEMSVGETREKACGMCLDVFEEGDKLKKLPCEHGFHESCAFDWLRVSRLCPYCRFALPAEEEAESEAESEAETVSETVVNEGS